MSDFPGIFDVYWKSSFLRKNEGAAPLINSIFERFLKALKGGYRLCRIILPFMPSGRAYGLFPHSKGMGAYARTFCI
jgi:hypothetical protein